MYTCILQMPRVRMLKVRRRRRGYNCILMLCTLSIRYGYIYRYCGFVDPTVYPKEKIRLPTDRGNIILSLNGIYNQNYKASVGYRQMGSLFFFLIFMSFDLERFFLSFFTNCFTLKINQKFCTV